jgi:hypothetical protein
VSLFVVVQPLLPENMRVRMVLTYILLLVILSAGVWAAARSSMWRWISGISGLLATAASWVGIAHQSFAAGIVAIIGYFAFFCACTLVVLRDVLGRTRVDFTTILGACAAYLLLAMTWAVAYAGLHWVDPTSFALQGSPYPGEAIGTFVYYSLVTITTLGFGDMTPVAPLARSLSALEAVVGQLYLAILVARLVGLQLQQRPTAESPTGKNP